ncbi:MAG: hypothetical protein J6U36_01490, partial [Oscillospiraceae bacterium]|nr:hypothetical protein [Oscillospiraceae bacterium]
TEYEVLSPSDGYITGINSEEIGLVSLELGAGRRTKESAIDYTAGVILEKEYGDFVKKGDKLFTLYTSGKCDLKAIADKAAAAVTFSSVQPPHRDCVIKIVG